MFKNLIEIHIIHSRWCDRSRLVGSHGSRRKRSHGARDRSAAGHQIPFASDRHWRRGMEHSQWRPHGHHQPRTSQRTTNKGGSAIALVHTAPGHMGTAAERPQERHGVGLQRRYRRSQVGSIIFLNIDLKYFFVSSCNFISFRFSP